MRPRKVDKGKMAGFGIKLSFLMNSKEYLLSTLPWNANRLDYEVLGELNRTRFVFYLIVLVLNATVLLDWLLVIAHKLKPFELWKELQWLWVLELNIYP